MEQARHTEPAGLRQLTEGGGWAAILPGLPVHGDGKTIDSALDDAILPLREYAEDWNGRLCTAPDHARHRPVVGFDELSTDEQLRDWLLGGVVPAAGARADHNRSVSPGSGRRSVTLATVQSVSASPTRCR